MTNAVKSPERQTPRIVAQRRRRARAHLARRLVGESDRENVFGRAFAARRQPRDARSQNPRLARARARQNQNRTAAMRDRLLLARIERGEIGVDGHFWRAAILAQVSRKVVARLKTGRRAARPRPRSGQKYPKRINCTVSFLRASSKSVGSPFASTSQSESGFNKSAKSRPARNSAAGSFTANKRSKSRARKSIARRAQTQCKIPLIFRPSVSMRRQRKTRSPSAATSSPTHSTAKARANRAAPPGCSRK